MRQVDCNHRAWLHFRNHPRGHPGEGEPVPYNRQNLYARQGGAG
jgi:hypothetical protein